MHIGFSIPVVALVGVCSLLQILQAQAPPDLTPPTPLIGAIMRNDDVEAKRLLVGGADPNEGRLLGGSPLLLAIMQGQSETARALIDQGADVKATDGRGATALMWAAGSETNNTGLVKELILRGIDVNARDKAGDTAILWAQRRGYTPVVELLKQHGASDADGVKKAVETAVALLQKSGAEFSKISSCASCHHQSLPQMAYGSARARGFAVDAGNSEQQVKALMAMYRPMRKLFAAGKEVLPDTAITVSYALVGLAAEGYKPDETTDAMAFLISTQQKADGSFRVLPARPPMESTPVTGTALSIRALKIYGKDQGDRIRRAADWLRTVKPRTHEERAMQLLGLSWAGAADTKSAVRGLFAEQRADGGWGQLPTLESDAYATGQALVALQASGVQPSHTALQRGVAFLIRTQHPDGSWLVRSRSVPFQPLKESGFPHGKHQWISAAGTAWAALGLSLVDPQTPQQQLSKAFQAGETR
jgi:hypothetical protein